MQRYEYSHPAHGTLILTEVSRSLNQRSGEEYVNCSVEGVSDRMLFQVSLRSPLLKAIKEHE